MLWHQGNSSNSMPRCILSSPGGAQRHNLIGHVTGTTNLVPWLVLKTGHHGRLSTIDSQYIAVEYNTISNKYGMRKANVNLFRITNSHNIPYIFELWYASFLWVFGEKTPRDIESTMWHALFCVGHSGVRLHVAVMMKFIWRSQAGEQVVATRARWSRHIRPVSSRRVRVPPLACGVLA